MEALSAALGKHQIALRSITENSNRGEAAARFEISFHAFAHILAAEREKRGRKVVLLGVSGVTAAGRLGEGARRKAPAAARRSVRNIVKVRSRSSSERARSPSSVWTLSLWGSLKSALQTRPPFIWGPPTGMSPWPELTSRVTSDQMESWCRKVLVPGL